MRNLVFLILLFFSQKPFAQDQYYLAIGESLSLKTRAFSTLKVQKKSILQIKDRGNRIVLIGKKIGKTQLIIDKQYYLVEVLKKREYETYQQLLQWQKNKRGPKIDIRKGQIIISGRILRAEDFISLTDYTNINSSFVIEADFYPHIKKQVQHFLKQHLLKNNLSFASLGFSPQLQLRLSADKKNQLSRYKKILTPYGVSPLIDKTEFGNEPIIQIQVYIAHVTKNFIRQWGVQWPSQITTTILPTNLDSFQISLNALETNGQGQVLAQPTLVTQSNKKAQFHSGGEFPIRTSTQFSNSLQWKKYGLFLNTTPAVNAQGAIRIEIDVQMSTLDQSLSSEGVPALVNSELKTQISLKEAKPILLSGFLRSNSAKGRQGLPWLQQIPIFKPLFSTGEIYNSELELVFILVPKILQN